MSPPAGACFVLWGGLLFVFFGPGTTARSEWLAVGGAMLLGGLVVLSKTRRSAPVGEPGWIFAALGGLALVFFSEIGERPFFHLSGGTFRATWLWFLVVGLLVARWLVVAPERRAPWLLVLAQLALVFVFVDFTHGAVPTRDDHPAFLYRFHLLREAFPRLVFYNPEWNGGYLATEIIATGALSPFLLALPFAWIGETQNAFAYAIPYFFVVLLPWIFFLSLRALGVSRAGAALGGLIALAPTMAVFLYELLYGVYPFVISCTLAVAAAALFSRLFLDGSGGIGSAVLLVAATSLCVAWPLGALMLAPVVPVFFAVCWRLTRRQWALALGTTAALLAINLPWIHALATLGDSARFVAEQRSTIATSGIAWEDAARTLRRLVEELHPLSLVFAPLAFVLWPVERRRLRWLVAALVGWSLLVAVLGPQVKAQIALERFSVSFALFAAAAAAVALGRLTAGTRAAWRTTAIGVVLAVLLMTTIGAADAYQNRGRYRTRLLPGDVERALAAIDERCPADRRVLVPGFSLHWFGGGHIAALPLLAKRSFLGNDYYHRRDYNDVVPPEYRRVTRFAEYLDLYDVGCVLTWNEGWAAALETFRGAARIHDEGWLRLYAVTGVGNRFLRGSGRVEERIGRLVVETEDDDVVIKYRWAAGIESRPRVTLEPQPIHGNVEFIRIRTNGQRRIEIRYP